MKLKLWLVVAAIAAVELAGMYWISTQMGVLSMLYLSLVTAFWGFSTLTRHGKALRQDYEDMQKDPAKYAAQIQVSEGGVEQVKSRYAEHMVGMGSGILLVVPGLVSDILGAALKIPALRKSLCAKAGAFIEKLPQNPKFMEFAAKQAGGMGGPGFPGQGFPGQGFPGQGVPGQGFPGHAASPAPRPSRNRAGPVIDTTAS